MLITIITPSLNRYEYIRDALDSLSGQGLEGIEHIVVDGGSTDGTIDMVRRDYPKAILIVERDRNLYDAINKGLRAASGEVIGLLNTDDRLLPGALEAVRDGFARHPLADSVCGGCEIRLAGSPLSTPPSAVLNNPAMKALRAEDVMSGLILLNGRFFRRRLFDRVGLFDAEFPILADRDFLARCLLSGLRTAVIEPVIYAYGAHAGSLTFGDHVNPNGLHEAVRLARHRLATAATARERAFYRRWHGWAVGYELLHLRNAPAECGRMAGLARDAFAQDPGWPLRFLHHLAWHVRTRGERR